MALLQKTNEQKVLNDLAEASAKLDKVIEKLGGRTEEKELTTEVVALKRQVAELEINKGKMEEEFARERREIEHMLGLQKKRAEQEAEMAAKQARLDVQEEHMKAKTDLFEERIGHLTKNLENQVAYLRDDIIKSLLTRLPTFDVQAWMGDRPGGARRRPALEGSAGEEE